MKVIVTKPALLSHVRRLRIARLKDRKLLKQSSLSFEVTDALYIETFGMRDQVKCKPQRWGNAVVPYFIWRHLMDRAKRYVKGDDWRIEVREGVLVFGPLQIKDPGIREVKADKSLLDTDTEGRTRGIETDGPSRGSAFPADRRTGGLENM